MSDLHSAPPCGGRLPAIPEENILGKPCAMRGAECLNARLCPNPLVHVESFTTPSDAVARCPVQPSFINVGGSDSADLSPVRP
jgi:hypothetical protein